MEAHLASLPAARIERGVEVIGVDSRDDGVTVAVRNGSGIRTLRGRYLIAADGIRSTVRAALGIPTQGPGQRRRQPRHPLPRSAVGGRRRASPRHLLRGRGRQEGRAPGRPARPLAGRPQRPRAAGRRARGPRGRRRARPRARDRERRHRRVRGRARRSLPRAQRVPGRRRRPPPEPARGDGDEHRDPRRLRPRLEARLGAARLGGRGAARQLRGRAPPGRRAQRPPRRGPERLRARRRRGAARRPRRPHPAHVAARRGRDASPRSTCSATGSRSSPAPARRRGRPAAAHPRSPCAGSTRSPRGRWASSAARRCSCAPTACPRWPRPVSTTS